MAEAIPGNAAERAETDTVAFEVDAGIAST